MAERQRRGRRAESTSAKAKGTVHVKTLKSRNVLTDEKAEVEFDAEIFDTEPAYVRISHGVTKSIGDYESLRIDVSLSVPCYKEQIDQIARDCGERVAIMLEDELDAYGVDLHGENK